MGKVPTTLINTNILCTIVFLLYDFRFNIQKFAQLLRSKDSWPQVANYNS